MTWRLSEPRVHPSGWNVISLLDAANIVAETHVVPADDLRDHDIAQSCWCQPVEDEIDPKLFGHNAADQRERIEEAGNGKH